MKYLSKLSTLLFSVLLLLTITVNCQTAGQIFTKSEANQIFGIINFSVELTVSEFQNFLEKTNNVLMFRIKDGKLEVLGDGRTPVSPSSLVVGPTEVFKVYSKSIMTELLNKGGSDTISVEQRQSLLTITNGGYTLELSLECPPWCP